MQRLLFGILAGFVAFTASSGEVAGTLRLLPLFSDHMVLQRQAEIPVWGWAGAGTEVTVAFSGQKKNTVAGPDGKWIVRFAPLEATASPAPLTVTAGTESLVIKDVLVGDVWLCSGQSNMVYQFGASKRPENFSLDYPLIREFTVPRSVSLEKRDEFKPPRVQIGHTYEDAKAWRVCSLETAGEFSAVALFFAMELNRELKIPIGILNCSFNGSSADLWIPAEILKKDLVYKDVFTKSEEVLRAFEKDVIVYEHDQAFFEGLKTELEKLRETDLGPELPDTGSSTTTWADTTIDTTGWSVLPWGWTYGKPVYAWDGQSEVWFRIPGVARAGTDDFLLQGGNITGDVTYFFNGRKLDPSQSGKDGQVSYAVKRSELVDSRGVLTIRVRCRNAMAGAWTWPAFKDDRIVTSGREAWYRVAARNSKGEFRLAGHKYPPSGINQYPGTRFNAMLNPVIPYAIKGFLWYQGEAECMGGIQATRLYAHTLPLLIKTWREQWGGLERPFIVVQLASVIGDPVQNMLMEQRESQKSALSLPNTGLSPSMDIREPGNWHPGNKYDIGRRAARTALKVAYGRDLVVSGPMYRGMTIEDNRIRVTFDAVGSGLMVGEKTGLEAVKELPTSDVPHFLIAGADLKFVPAKAKIDGATVLVWSDQVSAPTAVRYAWVNLPENPLLYNRDGLPACSFRSDPGDFAKK